MSSPKSREDVMVLMSGSVLENFKVCELLWEDRFGDAVVARASCATGWDIEREAVEVTCHGRKTLSYI